MYEMNTLTHLFDFQWELYSSAWELWFNIYNSHLEKRDFSVNTDFTFHLNSIIWEDI